MAALDVQVNGRQPQAANDAVLEQYARQLRRELDLVERKLRGEATGPE